MVKLSQAKLDKMRQQAQEFERALDTEVCGSVAYNDRAHIGAIIKAARQAAADNRYEEFHNLFGEALEEIYNIFVEQQNLEE